MAPQQRRLLLLLLIALIALSGCGGTYRAPVYSRGEASLPPKGVYLVHRGDTLYSIAFRHGLDYRQVARWNRIGAPYRIYPGQKLRLVPPRAASRGSSSASRARSDQSSTPRRPSPPPAAPAGRGELKWRWPTEGEVVRRFSANSEGKRGIELRGRAGQVVEAAAGGRVVYSGNGLRGYGNLVIIKHNGRYLTAYAYNQRILVKEGDAVAQGQKIARMGLDARKRPTLHFELRRDGKPVDPLRYLPRR